MRIKRHIQDMNFMTLKNRSLFTIMTLSLFTLSFIMISDAQTVYGIGISLPQNAVTESGFSDIAIADVKANENCVYLLYWDTGNNDSLKFISSFDNSVSWNPTVLLGTGVTITDILLPNVFS